ncbi:hypothetical protein TREMEDRAFT_39085 [Tremella mesenterica DSM 1558]|uniref:uncharacterized protein n=1 Tax=Tremella mesenterica (strain ATCC 24925 / CBS 8224 / DSM 1558 / NBRC 9311 / NRRL Y-6157 / RJB 2259-6 / UBC 559-6) TaxID=578456 RepID=UPI0003F48EC6|nr:uncharacterized protein TREMEDRAFT_39085 [Tremella mesenterica DSM 1558]EIW69500.1 hypothetical protein TREMEDRAFT_39085 [Tremella mesenterica DSM 1558]
MGVPGLWDLLRPAATRTSLSTLARQAVLSNHNGHRALTIGIDASIWMFHAQVPQHGENPFLRTIFYKITQLLQQPVLPVFVFDGPNKPSQKRNQNITGQFGTADHRSKQFKALLDECGLEWWNIDLTYSNSPTLSGAQASTITKNNPLKGDLRPYEVYRSEAIKQLWTDKEGTALKTEEDCRMAMVLIALLGGGDYAPEGLSGFGATISFGLANAGLCHFLKQYTSTPASFTSQLSSVHQQMVAELRTNSSRFMGRRYPARATELEKHDLATLFPTFTLNAYLRPVTSPLLDLTQGWPGFGQGQPSVTRGKARSNGRGDLEGMARACEKFFEWGTKDLVCKKFAGESVSLFGAEVMNTARDTLSRTPQVVSSSNSRLTSYFPIVTSSPSSSDKTAPVILPTSSSAPDHTPAFQERPKMPDYVGRICSIRPDPLNPDLKEYRISFSHSVLADRCRAAMVGARVDPISLDPEERRLLGLIDRGDDADALPPSSQVTSKTESRVWIGDYLIQEAWPQLVQAYENERAAKLGKATKPIKVKTASKMKTSSGKGKAKLQSTTEDSRKFVNFFTSSSQPSQGELEQAERHPEDSQSPSSSLLQSSSPPRHPVLREKSPSLPNLNTRSSSPPHIALAGIKAVSVSPSTFRRTRHLLTQPAPSSYAVSSPKKPMKATKPISHRVEPLGVIDLCSSSDESESNAPSMSRGIGDSSRRSGSPIKASRSTISLQTIVGAPSSHTQTLLDLPRTIRSSPRTRSATQTIARKQHYVLISATEDVEYFDVTRNALKVHRRTEGGT